MSDTNLSETPEELILDPFSVKLSNIPSFIKKEDI